MSQFLLLPREIRDKILAFAITDPKSPPATLHDDPSRSQPKTRWNGEPHVKHLLSAESYKPSSTALLLTNHQLHAETKDFLRRTPLRYALDVMVANELWLLPTWTCIPSLSSQIDIIEATFRVVTPNIRRSVNIKSGFRRGDGDPGRMSWALYHLLTRFFELGPAGPNTTRKGKEKENPFIIHNLHINVETPTNLPDGAEIEPLEPGGMHHRVYGRRYDDEEDSEDETGEPSKLYMHPKYLSDFIIGELGGLLYMGYHTARYGAVLYERMGRISVSVDGELEREMDLGEMFRAFPPEGPYQAFDKGRQRSFPEWWEEARRIREGAGL